MPIKIFRQQEAHTKKIAVAAYTRAEKRISTYTNCARVQYTASGPWGYFSESLGEKRIQVGNKFRTSFLAVMATDDILLSLNGLGV